MEKCKRMELRRVRGRRREIRNGKEINTKEKQEKIIPSEDENTEKST